MTRDANIPLILWLSSAVLFHLVGGGGAHEAAQVAQDEAALRTLSRGVREQLHPPDTTFEVMTEDAVPTPAPSVAAPEAPDDPDKDEKPDPEELKKLDPEVKKPLPPPPPKPEAKKKEPPKPEEKKKEPPKPKPEPPKPVPVVQLPPMPPPPPPPPLPKDHRLAVKQNVAKDQPDNPNASRIADEANTVAEELMAKLRSHDQDDPNPSPGKAMHPGPKGEPGNDDHDKVADSETKKGDPEHAPGEAKAASTAITHDSPTPPQPPTPGPSRAPRMGGMGGPRFAGAAPAPASPPPSPGGAGPASPAVINGVNGGYTLNPENPGGDGKSRRSGKKRVAAAVDIPVHPNAIGFGQGGLSLTQQSFEAAIGAKTLKQERASDGAARRSAHRGSFETNKFDRYRAAIENYDPSVKAGNQTALNAARVPFASYINAIHNRIHPIFAEQYLSSLESMPKGTAMAAADLVTHLEIVLSKDQGRIVRLGVTRASGVTAFDVAALDSVNRAQPYGKAPDMIVSPDGNVYLHWEFHRDPYDACSTRNASPFLLAAAPAAPGKPPPPKRPGLGAPRDEAPGPGPLLPLQGH